MVRFASPFFLVLLALIPLLGWRRSRAARPALAGTDPGAAAVEASPALKIERLVPLLGYMALALMIVALARPQWGTRRTTVPTSGINIVLALDLSDSMAALDFHHEGQRLDRLAAVKQVVRQFVDQRAGDRIGMVVFGSQAYTQLPLTRDYATIHAILDRLQIGAAGRATAVGDAVGIALKRLKDIESRSNVIILLTDGRSNSGALTPETAADIARRQGVKVHAIGVGGVGRAPFLIKDPLFGERLVYQPADLDEPALRMIAEKTGGLFFRAEDLEGLRKIYDTIDTMEKNRVDVDTYAEFSDLYIYLLLPALGVLTLWVVLINTRFLRLP
jgi:Ca-activated chloride channel family protein